MVSFSKVSSSSLPDEWQYGACDDLYDASYNRNWGRSIFLANMMLNLGGLLLGDGASLSTF